MLAQGKKNVLGVLVDVIDYAAAVTKIITAAQQHEPYSVTALAVHGVMTGVLDPVQRYRLNALDLVVPDGQPVRWALNWLHRARLTDRVYGPTLMLNVCERAAAEGLPIFLYGSRLEVLNALRNKLLEHFPELHIAGMEPSRFRQTTLQEKHEIAERIQASGAAITFVGLGCPRQETWVYEYRNAVSMPLIAVGAAFDFHAGLLPQAPPHLQRSGLEWLYRLWNEPKRLWRRYLFLNPAYLALLFLQLTKIRTIDPVSSRPPKQEVRYG